ncbi:unnamed protein product [Lasius platythorax]|uniref:Vitellogenin n=1 Tax=Lasius platythorax TaxID=488582 RepID=A0AAV2MYN2_9HYME
MHSHVSIVHNGRSKYIRKVSANTCKKLHNTKTIFLGGSALISGLKVNFTTTLHSPVLPQRMDAAPELSDPFGTWDNVVVQGTVKITKSLQLPARYSTNEVILPSGARCHVTNGGCNDADGMTTYWSVLPIDSCQFNRYDVLYQGPAYRLTSISTQKETPIIYTVTTKDTTFALAKTNEFNLCEYKILRTEHSKPFILETQPDHTFKVHSKVSIENLDIFSFVNSKFIYVEKHLKTQLTQLYRDIIKQKCALQRQILENALSLASIAPNEMAHKIIKTLGYTAIMAGEAIHLIKCVLVECRIRQINVCYNS